jgi:hypothetical protein
VMSLSRRLAHTSQVTFTMSSGGDGHALNELNVVRTQDKRERERDGTVYMIEPQRSKPEGVHQAEGLSEELLSAALCEHADGERPSQGEYLPHLLLQHSSQSLHERRRAQHLCHVDR